MLAPTNYPGYVKDTDTGTIINNDDQELQKFLAARELSKRNNNLSSRMSAVENDLSDIKRLLLQLVHRNN